MPDRKVAGTLSGFTPPASFKAEDQERFTPELPPALQKQLDKQAGVDAAPEGQAQAQEKVVPPSEQPASAESTAAQQEDPMAFLESFAGDETKQEAVAPEQSATAEPPPAETAPDTTEDATPGAELNKDNDPNGKARLYLSRMEKVLQEKQSVESRLYASEQQVAALQQQVAELNKAKPREMDPKVLERASKFAGEDESEEFASLIYDAAEQLIADRLGDQTPAPAQAAASFTPPAEESPAAIQELASFLSSEDPGWSAAYNSVLFKEWLQVTGNKQAFFNQVEPAAIRGDARARTAMLNAFQQFRQSDHGTTVQSTAPYPFLQPAPAAPAAPGVSIEDQVVPVVGRNGGNAPSRPRAQTPQRPENLTTNQMNQLFQLARRGGKRGEEAQRALDFYSRLAR